MSKLQMLRASVSRRLSAAAEEIFELFGRAIAEYEEELCRCKEENERQQRLLDAVLSPEVLLHRAVSTDVQQLLGGKEEVPSEQQDWSSSLDQEAPPEPPPHIKEEQEELWTSQGGEQLRGLEDAEIIKFTFSPVPVKSEDDEDEDGDDDEAKPQTSQRLLSQTEEHLETEADGEGCGGAGPAGNFNPHRHDKTSHSSESESDDYSHDWDETREPQAGLIALQNDEAPLSDEEFGTGETLFISPECDTSFDQTLQKHNGIQTAVKPFSCSVCGKRYPRKKTLMDHRDITAVCG
ncbi:zinc finger protein with KRAB and SCAN domains 1-like [Pempheris klunzingeri]|uniref:zinc finger protein with KRAB and SCAN domains 1-like n=1 Tax=Pempheris klunzingeri TaxID=3127111 RepID=UPI0039817847